MPPQHLPDSATEVTGGWRTTLWFMVAIQVMMSMSLSVLNPMLPLFLPDLGVRAPKEIYAWSGILISSNLMAAAAVAPIWGMLADRFGRKAMVLRSSSAICVFTLLMAGSGSLWQLFTLRMAMGLFAGFGASALALVATRTPEDRLGYALGWLSSGQILGMLAGPLVGGLLADVTGSYRAVFVWTAALAAIAAGLTWRFVPADRPGGARDPSAGRTPQLTVIRTIAPMLLVIFLAQFTAQSIQPVITVHATRLIGPSTHISVLAGLAFSISGLGYLASAPFLARRSDKIGHRRALLIMLVGASAMTVPQAFTGSYWLFVMERFGVGVFTGGAVPTANALVGRLTSSASRGSAYGTTSTASFLGGALGPLAGAAVAATIGVPPVFLMAALLMAGNVAWILLAVPAPPRGATAR